MISKASSSDGEQAYHLVATSHKYCHRSRVGAFFNDQHLFSRRTERQFPHDARSTQLLCRQVFEPRNDSSVGRDGDELDFGTSDPSNGRQVILHQQVVGFVVETPLADDKVGTGVLDPKSASQVSLQSAERDSREDVHLDHVQELFPLILSQLLVLFHTLDIQLVLCLWPRRLERTSQDRKLGILEIGRAHV